MFEMRRKLRNQSNQSRDSRAAFTLIEMMVVIAIIGVLAGLLLVALGPVRARARLAQCQNNLRNLAQATQTFATDRGRYPGSFEWSPHVNSAGIREPWPWSISLLPYLDEKARYDELYAAGKSLTPKASPGGNPAVDFLPVYICPADPMRTAGFPHLNYVANCGTNDLANVEAGNWGTGNGIFCSQLSQTPASPAPMNAAAVQPLPMNVMPIRCEPTRIKDGQAQTLLYSENMDATTWQDNAVASGEFGVGVLWNVSCYPFNENTGTKPISQMTCRPSGLHSTGFSVAMCDGSTKFANEAMSNAVWWKMMTRDGKRAAADTGVGAAAGIISEADFEVGY